MPDPGQGADDRVVGPGASRVLLRHRGDLLHLREFRGLADPQGHGRPVPARPAPRLGWERGRTTGWPRRHAVLLGRSGFLYLTDRVSHMIISGGVNIYPQEAE